MRTTARTAARGWTRWNELRKPKINAYGLKGWALPHETYKRAVWLVRDYPRIKREYEDMLTDTPAHDGQLRSSKPGDPTQTIAVKRAALADDVHAVEQALQHIPPEDAKEIMRHLAEGKDYTVPAHRNTWQNRMKPFLYMVAIYRGY